MAEIKKTPGVYIQEMDAFPNSVVEVPTAVPVFIGYTEKAMAGGVPVAGKPIRLSSMWEFTEYFGGPAPAVFELGEFKPLDVGSASPFNDATRKDPRDQPIIGSLDGKNYALSLSGEGYFLHSAMRQFFQNGGGECYVVSVGSYSDPITRDDFTGALTDLEDVPDITLVLAPESVRLSRIDNATVSQLILRHCSTLRNRFAILDVFGGWRPLENPLGDQIKAFRTDIGTEHLDFGAAYYPWLKTAVELSKDFTFQNIKDHSNGLLADLLKASLPPGQDARLLAEIDKLNAPKLGAEAAKMLDAILRSMVPLYENLVQEMTTQRNLLPPSAAMAGVYALMDRERGVWKAPANLGLIDVVSPSATVDDEQQGDLNVPIDGKAVNAIRLFRGRGTLVWGARTLDGNSLDWRYINVRRTVIMIEQSIEAAIKPFVFKANDATTWASISTMVKSFLTNIWKQGGLAGASANDAFTVQIGLGSTMTAQDIKNGIMRLSVAIALVHPAEFFVLEIEQKMQES